MVIHTDPFFSIYFGDARTQFIPAQLAHIKSTKELLQESSISFLKRVLHINELVFLHQTHSSSGLCISSRAQIETLPPFGYDGDFIITNVSNIGLAVATADCLPIIMYDSFNHCIAIVHAGWRGSVGKVAIAALEQMQTYFKSSVEHTRIFFGPSAKVCCYTIGSEVLQALEQFSFAHEVVLKFGSNVLFDLPLFNRLLLIDYGIKKEAFHLTYNNCTICDESFCSYRRQRSVERQSTVVALK